MKLLNLSRYFLSKKCYSSCSVKDILKTQPVGSKKKLKVIFYVLMLFVMYIYVLSIFIYITYYLLNYFMYIFIYKIN